MRKEDIIITTPEHSTIYAIGTSPESNDNVWADHNSWPDRRYRPGYVLEIKTSGFAVVLMAEYHPENPFLKSNLDHTPNQASLMEATGYSLADYQKRQEVLAEHSHWHQQDGGREAREDALEALKSIPEGWKVVVIRTTYIRMFWAEYVERHDIKISERAAIFAKQKADTAKRMSTKRHALDALVKTGLKIGDDDEKEPIEYAMRRSWVGDSNISLPVETIAELVAGYNPKHGA
jgi:hypothetical protein